MQRILLIVGVGNVLFGSVLFSSIYTNTAYATPLQQNISSNASIRVRSFCSMTATIEPGKQHAATMINGQYLADIGLTTIQTFCNDPSGYVIYAIGYTDGDAGITGGYNTVLRSSALGPTYDIPTDTNTSGDTSGWAMKLASVPGTYEGQVKYVLLYPSDHDAPAGNYKMQDVEDWSGTRPAVAVVPCVVKGAIVHVAGPDQPQGMCRSLKSIHFRESGSAKDSGNFCCDSGPTQLFVKSCRTSERR